MLRIEDENVTTPLESTSLTEQGYREEHLREWILDGPDAILGEDLLVIGREVSVENIGDAIDLLGIDRDGNVVVIELKKGALSGNVDFQSLKYTAYTSYWDWEQLADQFDNFKGSKWGQELYDEGADFTEQLESFCNDEYELNQNQRILLVGEDIRERLDLVVRWLSEREIDISVVVVRLLKDGEQLYLDAEQTIPVPESTASGINPDISKDPWKRDGKNWHLENKLDDEAADSLKEVVGALKGVESLEGPYWGQKQYVSFKQNRKNRVIARTRTTVFKVEIYDISTGEVDAQELADAIGVPVEDVRVEPEDLRDGRPGIRITCRGGQSLDAERLAVAVEKMLADGE